MIVASADTNLTKNKKLADTAQQTADDAAQTAGTALLSADGKNQVYYQPDPPTGTSFSINDMWFDTDNGYVISRWNGSTWVLSKFDFNALNINKLSAISADLGNVTAGNITGVTLNLAGGKVIVDANGNATFSGSLNGASGTFSGDLSGGTIYCDGTSGGRFVYTNAIDLNPNTGGNHVYIRPKIAVGEVRITETGSLVNYLPIRASGILANSIDVNDQTVGTHVYVRPTSAGEVRFTVTGSTTNYTNVRGSLAYFDGIANNNGTNLYLGTTTEVYVTTVGMASNNPIIWQPIRAAGFKGDYFESNPSTAGTHVYVRPKTGSEVRFTSAGSTTSYENARGQFFYCNAVDINTGTHLYIRPSSTGEVRATVTGDTATYVPVRASSFPTGSMAEYKQDIAAWEESALDLINNSTIYQYRLISEVQQGKDRIRQGLVIGDGYDTPIGVVDGDGVEQYLMNSWSWKAIQELFGEFTDLFTKFTDLDTNVLALSTQVTDLLSKFTDLDARVTNLEAVS